MGLSTTYTKTETDFLIQQLEKKTSSGYKGDLSIVDAAPTAVGLYGLSETGIYTNLGGINAQSGKLNFASFDGTTWSLIAVDFTNLIPSKTFVENTSISNLTFGIVDVNTIAKTVTTTGIYYARLGKQNINIANTTLDFSTILGTSTANILLYINSSNVLSAIKTSSYVLNEDDKHICILRFDSGYFTSVLYSNVEILKINGVNHNAYNTSKVLDYKIKLEVGEKNAIVKNVNLLNGGLPKTFLSFESGYLGQDGTVKTSASRGVTDYIPTANLISYVNENSLPLTSINIENGVFCAFYDSTNAFISVLKYTDFQQASTSLPTGFIFDGLIPPNATSVRFNLWGNTSRITLIYKGERYDKKVSNDMADFALVKNANLPAKQVGYLQKDGTIFTGSTSRYITDYYEIKNIKRIISGVWSINDANSVYATVYDASKNIITTLADGVISSHEILDTLIPRIANAKYIRFTVGSSSGVAIVETWNNTKNTESTIKSANLVFDNETTQGYYLGLTGALETQSAPWNRQVCDFVAIPDNVTAIHLFDCVATAINGYGVCAFYDENKNFISMHFANDLGLTASAVLKYRKVVDIPFNAKYIRCNYDRTGADYPDYCPNMIFEINYGKPIGYNSPLYRGKIAVCGGSFSRIKSSQEAKKLWQETLFCEIFNYGVGGRGFAYPNPTTDSVQTQVDTAMASGISFDCVVLWASTNDINNGVQVGTVNDYTSADSYTTRTTQNGGINYCIKKIMDSQPLSRIYFFSSLRIFTSDFGYNPYSTSTNGAGFHFIDYVNGQKNSTNRFNVPLLDMYQIGGFNEYNYTQFYQADSLHMNDAGYKRVGYIQAEFLRTGLGNI